MPGAGKTFIVKHIKSQESEMGGEAPRILSLDDYFECDGEVNITVYDDTLYQRYKTFHKSMMQTEFWHHISIYSMSTKKNLKIPIELAYWNRSGSKLMMDTFLSFLSTASMIKRSTISPCGVMQNRKDSR